MDSRHAQTQSYEQWDFMKREIRASRTCSVTQDVAQQAEVRQLRGEVSFERGIRTSASDAKRRLGYAHHNERPVLIDSPQQDLRFSRLEFTYFTERDSRIFPIGISLPTSTQG